MPLSLQFSVSRTARAKKRVQTIGQNMGLDLKLIGGPAVTVTTDKLGHITNPGDSGSILVFKTYPIRHTPFDRSITASISWSGEVDVITFVAKQDVDDILPVNTFSLKDLKLFQEALLEDRTYHIQHIEPHDHVGKDFLFYRFGFKKPGNP